MSYLEPACPQESIKLHDIWPCQSRIEDIDFQYKERPIPNFMVFSWHPHRLISRFPIATFFRRNRRYTQGYWNKRPFTGVAAVPLAWKTNFVYRRCRPCGGRYPDFYQPAWFDWIFEKNTFAACGEVLCIGMGRGMRQQRGENEPQRCVCLPARNHRYSERHVIQKYGREQRGKPCCNSAGLEFTTPYRQFFVQNVHKQRHRLGTSEALMSRHFYYLSKI